MEVVVQADAEAEASAARGLALYLVASAVFLGFCGLENLWWFGILHPQKINIKPEHDPLPGHVFLRFHVKSSGVYGCCKRCFWHELEGTIAVGKHPLRWIRRNQFNSCCYWPPALLHLGTMTASQTVAASGDGIKILWSKLYHGLILLMEEILLTSGGW